MFSSASSIVFISIQGSGAALMQVIDDSSGFLKACIPSPGAASTHRGEESGASPIAPIPNQGPALTQLIDEMS